MSTAEIAGLVLAAVPARGRALVAVDGIGASGKTSFTEALARHVTTRPVVVLHTDDFFHVAEVRHARGRYSAEGFWRDAFDTEALRESLDHLVAGGDGVYRHASFDARAGRSVRPEPRVAPPDALVLVEGVFLHRDELAGYWDVSLWLDVTPDEAARRMVARDGLRPGDPRLARYAGAQRLYTDAAGPRDRASFVVDMSDPAAPRVVRRAGDPTQAEPV